MSFLQGLLFSGALNGIRTAARKKVGISPRIPIETLIVVQAAKAMKKMFPQVRRLHLVGSRLRHKYGRDLEFVAVVDREEDMPGRTIVDLQFGSLKVDLFFSLPEEVETHILEFGLGFDNLRWKRYAKEKGFKLNRYGLWKNGQLVTRKMAEIAAIVGLPLKPFLVMTLRNPF